MPFELALPARFRKQWRVKIYDNERLEPPHVTIIHRTTRWRFGLRDGRFLEDDPPVHEVDGAVLKQVAENLELLRIEWNRMYPGNPV